MLPTYEEMMLPLLKFLADGREHSFEEVKEFLAQHFQLTDEERKEPLKSGFQTKFANRVGWASTYLSKAGLLKKPKRGVWEITERGKEVLAQNPSKIDNEFLTQFEEFQKFRQYKPAREQGKYEKEEILTPIESIEKAVEEENRNCKEELLEKILNSTPEFFEKIVLDLIIKMGYGGSLEEAAQHLGRSGDEGVDGVIKEDLLGLDNIYIQAKRWKSGTIGRQEIQRFVGALHGKGAKKGLFITTGKFSREAEEYANNITDIRVILIDREKLLDYMLKFNVGVRTSQTFEIKKIDEDYFLEE